MTVAWSAVDGVESYTIEVRPSTGTVTCRLVQAAALEFRPYNFNSDLQNIDNLGLSIVALVSSVATG